MEHRFALRLIGCGVFPPYGENWGVQVPLAPPGEKRILYRKMIHKTDHSSPGGEPLPEKAAGVFIPLRVALAQAKLPLVPASFAVDCRFALTLNRRGVFPPFGENG